MWRSLAEKEEEGWVAKTRGTRVRENVVVITRKDVRCEMPRDLRREGMALNSHSLNMKA